jgi:hypothetical protein
MTVNLLREEDTYKSSHYTIFSMLLQSYIQKVYKGLKMSLYTRNNYFARTTEMEVWCA